MPIYSTPPRAVQAAYVSYILYTLPPTVPPAPPLTSLQLTWPTSYQDSPYVVAAYMEINGTFDDGFPIYLPDATQTSVGQNFIISNINVDPLGPQATLLDSTGTPLFNVVPGQKYYVILVDNSTPAGVWHNLNFGVGGGTTNPADLIGYGLNALALPPTNLSRINTEILVNPLSAVLVTYDVTITDYTSLIVWTSGAATITLPPISATLPTPPGSVPPFFYVSINNAGTGQVIIASAAGIQGQPAITLNTNETVTLIASDAVLNIGTTPSQWVTLAQTTLNVQAVTVNDINVSGSSNVTLGTGQASAGIQVYRGTKTGPVTVFFPASQAGQWWINNVTTDAFDLSVQLSGPTGTAYVIPKNARQLLFNDDTGTTIQSMPFPDPAPNVVTANEDVTAGIATLGSTSPGVATVDTTAVTATSVILITPREAAPMTGRQVTVSAIVPGVSFTIASSDTVTPDISDVSWLIVNPAP